MLNKDTLEKLHKFIDSVAENGLLTDEDCEQIINDFMNGKEESLNRIKIQLK